MVTRNIVSYDFSSQLSPRAHQLKTDIKSPEKSALCLRIRISLFCGVFKRNETEKNPPSLSVCFVCCRSLCFPFSCSLGAVQQSQTVSPSKATATARIPTVPKSLVQVLYAPCPKTTPVRSKVEAIWWNLRVSISLLPTPSPIFSAPSVKPRISPLAHLYWAWYATSHLASALDSMATSASR